MQLWNALAVIIKAVKVKMTLLSDMILQIPH